MIEIFKRININHQKDCEDGFVKDKPHLKMNAKYNLIPLCESCHHKTHHGELDINEKSTVIGARVSSSLPYCQCQVTHLPLAGLCRFCLQCTLIPLTNKEDSCESLFNFDFGAVNLILTHVVVLHHAVQ